MFLSAVYYKKQYPLAPVAAAQLQVAQLVLIAMFDKFLGVAQLYKIVVGFIPS